jgi:gliding motility-associated-like protein
MTQSSTSASLRPYLLVLCFLCSYFHASAQLSKHGNIWHFGYGGGLDFTTGTPVPLANINMDSYEGCASWCDLDGNLQLYTNGGGIPDNFVVGPHTGYIWNKNQQVMHNMGDDTGGGYSAAQGALIIPQPGSPNLLYVFTMDHAPNSGPENRGLSYFVVDMNLNGGNGGLTQTNVNIYKPSVEGMTAIQHANGVDYWIVCMRRESGEFIVTPFTSAGVGTPIEYENDGFAQGNNLIKASPDGKRFCSNGSIYNFDQSTGKPSFSTSVGADFYTFSFSPSGRYLYTFLAPWYVVRYDLFQALGDIPKSIDTLTTLAGFPFTGLMQLAPDGNIYFVEQSELDFVDPLFPTVGLSVIRCPDGTPEIEQGLHRYETDLLNAGGFFTSLPNFPDHIFLQKTTADTVQVVLCDTIAGVTLTPTDAGIRYVWSTRDSTQQITVKQAGTYTCFVEQPCTYSATVFVVENLMPSVEIALLTPIVDSCNAFPLILAATASPAGGELTWSTGELTSQITINDYGAYAVKYSNVCGKVSAEFVFNAPPVSVSVSTVIPVIDTCNAFPLELAATGSAGNYLWSNGSTTTSTTINAFGTYTVTVANGCGNATAQYSIQPIPVEVALLSPVIADTCNAFPLTLSAAGSQGLYAWSNGTTTAQNTIDAFGTYSVTVTNGCGTATAAYTLDPLDISVDIKAQNPVTDSCDLSGLTLLALPSHVGTLRWSDGSTQETFVVEEFGIFSVTLTNACGVATDTFRFEKPGSGCCDPRFPNAFTPDGDAQNEAFYPLLDACEVEYVEMDVYSRWGELVFQGVEPTDRWEGKTLNGTSAASDLYVYICRYKLKNESAEKFVKGEIYLLR